MKNLKAFVKHYPFSLITTVGFLWLLIEPILGLTGIIFHLTAEQFFIRSAFCALVWNIVDGVFFAGFLRNSIEINSNALDTKIIIKYGNLFKQDGCIAIAVNDFFDSLVDDRHISRNSLHGKLLENFWRDNVADWDMKVNASLMNEPISETVERSNGKRKRYPIGTTAVVRRYEQSSKFLCVALTKTDIETCEVKATAADLLQAIHGLLRKARSVCSAEALNIPLMGAGLSRIGIKNDILVDLILTAIFEETKINKITGEIRIILSKQNIPAFDFLALKKDWS